MGKIIFISLYFFLPAYIANAAPVLFKWLPYGQKPISEKYLGANKTWRGFLVGFLAALCVLALQYFISASARAPTFSPYELLHYANFSAANILLYAFIFGIGALFGDSVKSYFKRLLKIKPGRPFVPFDQIDLILGTLLFLWIFSFFSATIYFPDVSIIIAALIITPVLHLLSNICAYLLGLKKVWW